jgi:hypothetical protein
MSASSFALELLDTESGHVLQQWDLGGGDVFQLGRSRDCDVVIGSPFVSRIHVCLQHGEQGWELSAVSRSGVFVEGERVEHIHLNDGLAFRLAERGPVLRFRALSAAGSTSAGETICFDSSRTPLLILDEERRDLEVEEIIADDYFKELQRKVAQLRMIPPRNS